MARVTLNAQQIILGGLEPTYAAAEVDGNAFSNTGVGKKFVHVKNGLTPVNVTFVTPNTVSTANLAIADMVVAIPANEERMIGPFPSNVFNQSDGLVHIDYDDISNVTIAILRID